MGTKQLWIITAEILVKPSDLASGDTKGFTNVVTWADSPKTAEQKMSEVLKSYGWEVLGIESARPSTTQEATMMTSWTSLIRLGRILTPASLERCSATSQTSGGEDLSVIAIFRQPGGVPASEFPTIRSRSAFSFEDRVPPLAGK